MSAFATQARWVLAQQAVPDKANEITAIPDLWAMLELNGAGVSIWLVDSFLKNEGGSGSKS
jgi:hypothetical protein